MARFQTGDQKGAIEDVQMALEIEPNSQVMKNNLELFKKSSPGELTMKAKSEFEIRHGHLTKDAGNVPSTPLDDSKAADPTAADPKAADSKAETKAVDPASK
jgi:hypothetical protein